MNLNFKHAIVSGLVTIALSLPNQATARNGPDCSANVRELANIAQMVEDGYKSSGTRTKYPWTTSTNQPMSEKFLDCLNLGVINSTGGQYYIKHEVKKVGNHEIHHYCLDHVKDELCPFK